MGDRVDTIVIGQHPLAREGLVRILPPETFHVVAQLSDMAGIQAAADVAVRPLLCLLVAGDSRAATTATIMAVKREYPLSRIVVLAQRYDLADVVGALRAGAQAYLLDAMCCEAFLKSLDLILLGQCVLPSPVLTHIRDTWTGDRVDPFGEPPPAAKTAPRPPGPAPLSYRESEILQCLAEGASNKVIARRFDIAEATVKVHLKAILRKLGARNRTQAALWSVANLPPNGPEPLNPSVAPRSTD